MVCSFLSFRSAELPIVKKYQLFWKLTIVGTWKHNVIWLLYKTWNRILTMVLMAEMPHHWEHRYFPPALQPFCRPATIHVFCQVNRLKHVKTICFTWFKSSQKQKNILYMFLVHLQCLWNAELSPIQSPIMFDHVCPSNTLSHVNHPI